MYKKIISSLLLMTSACYCFSQPDKQLNIVTSAGVFAVSKNIDGKDMIMFKKEDWDKMQYGTKYTSDNLYANKPMRFCMEISNKHLFQCKSGIGFECSVFDCATTKVDLKKTVDHSNRICNVLLKKENEYTVKLIFLNTVNWNDL